jgi:DNA ligase (NAD+)
MDKIKRIKELIQKLNEYAYAYYSLGKPIVEDSTYDKLYDELLQLEEETGIILSNSITQSVGGKILDKLQKVKHEYPLLSLDKTKKVEDINKFRKGKTIIEMDKEDGLTIDITYDNGELKLAETRGDGEVGEDITHNVKQFTNVPLTIPYKNKVHIIGEAIITYDVFEEINSKLQQDKQYKNPRNLVSGSVRQLDSNICKERKVKFIGYIVKGNNMLQTKQSQFDFTIEQGFDCVNYTVIEPTNTIEYIKNSLETMKNYAESIGNPIDGQVFTYDDISYGESLGRTAKFPLHSIAFKFTEDVELTTLKDVEWGISRTGRVTPVAIFDTVELAGTEVSRATLNNLTILKSLQLGIGDTISVKKANEIIPMIVDNITKSNTLKIPTTCPECREDLTIKNDTDSEFLYCINDNCKAKLVQKLTHYVSRNTMNIEGLSEATIEKFIELGYLKSIQDIYYLASDKCKYKNEIIKLNGFGKKSFENLVNAINKSKQCKLENFIYALGIPNVGKSTAKNMVKYCKGDTPLETINNIINTLPHIWTEMKDCGGVVSNSIHEWFDDKSNLEMLGYLTQMELTFIEDNPKETKQGVFSGKTIYATGTFANYKKNDLKEIIESNGGTFASGYAKSLSYLVVGSVKGSSKVDKALKDNVSVLTEDEFVQIIKGN